MALLIYFILKEAGGPKSKAIAEWMEEALETWFYENKDLEAVEVNEYTTLSHFSISYHSQAGSTRSVQDCRTSSEI